jgi:hypothetical protein
MPNELSLLIEEVSAKFCGYKGVAWSAQPVSTAVNLGFLDRSHYFSIKVVLNYPHEVEWTPLQTHCFSGNLVRLDIEPRYSGFVSMNSDD